MIRKNKLYVTLIQRYFPRRLNNLVPFALISGSEEDIYRESGVRKLEDDKGLSGSRQSLQNKLSFQRCDLHVHQ